MGTERALGRRHVPLALAIAALAGGCSAAPERNVGASPSPSAARSSPGPAAPGPPVGWDEPTVPRRRGTARQAYGGLLPVPRVPAAVGGHLPASHADRTTIQAQPPPGTCRARGSGLLSLPDRRCTPGAIDPAVTQANIGATICRAGYTRRVRPPESVTEPEKVASLAAYSDHLPRRDYEYDHLVALELGGAPNDPRNLWPEPGRSPNAKDELENRMRALVCDRTMGLAAAQLEIAGDWVAASRHLSGRGA